ncbi:uncharacterized protein LOC117175580 [Belonocnema kinseyi]|uniref:uncharacterized protein LOC117175580 n=1 Tax=Belonocnema kinseyi TaxID=2817044 RepID=UPI00143CE11F|nr:uncharacterized protein LOC117175580 [Belonocnema kinseyi]
MFRFSDCGQSRQSKGCSCVRDVSCCLQASRDAPRANHETMSKRTKRATEVFPDLPPIRERTVYHGGKKMVQYTCMNFDHKKYRNSLHKNCECTMEDPANRNWWTQKRLTEMVIVIRKKHLVLIPSIFVLNSAYWIRPTGKPL